MAEEQNPRKDEQGATDAPPQSEEHIEKDAASGEETPPAAQEPQAGDSAPEAPAAQADGEAGGLPPDGEGKKRRRGKPVAVLLSIAIALFAVGGVLGLLYAHSYNTLEEMKAAVDVQGFYPGVTIDGQDVGGRSYDEVREEILARQQEEANERVITVEYGGQSFTLPLLSSYDTDQVIVEAYNYAKEGELQERYDKVAALREQPLDFATTCVVTADGVDAFVQQVAEAIDVPAKDAAVEKFDPETKPFTFTDEATGLAVDKEQLRQDIETAVAEGTYATPIVPTMVETQPTVTKAQLQEQNTLLASFTTETTSSTSRNTNIRLCA